MTIVPENLSSEERELYAMAVLGQDADDFFKSELGQYVVGVSMEHVQSARIELETVNPDDSVKITQLQTEIFRARAALQWLDDMITQGREALHQLESMEE